MSMLAMFSRDQYEILIKVYSSDYFAKETTPAAPCFSTKSLVFSNDYDDNDGDDNDTLLV